MTTWIEIGALSDIPVLGSRVVRTAGGDIAVFRTGDDEVFALDDKCPHKGGHLSQGKLTGLVAGYRSQQPRHLSAAQFRHRAQKRYGGRARRGMYARASDQGGEQYRLAVCPDPGGGLGRRVKRLRSR